MIGLYNKELSRETSIYSWYKFISEIDKIIELAEECEINLLSAYGCVIKIWVLSIQLSLHEEAKAIFDNKIEFFKNYKDEVYIIYDGYAKGLYDSSLHNESYTIFNKTINLEIHNAVLEHIFSLNFFSRKIYENNLKLALTYSKKAYELVLKEKDFPIIQKAKIIGEYSFYNGQNGDYLKAVIILENGFELLIKDDKKEDEWKVLFMQYAHVFNYYQSLLINHIPPEKDIKGKEYNKPDLGYFQISEDREILNYYFEDRLFINCYLVLIAFEALGNFAIASKWAKYIFQELKYRELKVFQSLKTSIIPYLLIQNKYFDGISISFVSWKSLEKPENSIIFLKSILPTDVNVGKKLMNPIKSEFIEYAFLNVIISIFFLSLNDKLNNLELLLFDWSKKYDSEEQWLPYLKIIQDGQKLNSNSQEELQIFINEYTSEANTNIKVLGCILSSLYTTNIETFYLQFSVFKYLEKVISIISPGAINFIITPFFIDFWKERFRNHSVGLKEHTFWIEKSLPRIETALPAKKLKYLSQALLHHLNIDNNEIEEWILKE